MSAEQDELAKLRDAVKDVRMAMLSTVNGGRVMSRPMGTQEIGDDGTLWFLTSAESNKVREIAENPSVGISYCDSGAETYVSIAGLARVVNDRALIRKFWNPFYKAWFEGPDDPTIRVVEVQPQSAEYWVTKGGKIVSLLSAFSSAITGKNLEAGENKTVQL
ncbi:MAG TPA: pyridoxamine 5'-phosphate oxidase family protein [Gemmatimonadaceae bacterium]|jgi:general stress protein 26